MFTSEREFESCPGIKRRSNGRNPRVQRSVKRCIDLLGAGILTAVLFPVFIVIGLLVVLDDGWPVIYRRRVVGAAGEFDAFKFRTMIRDADSILAANPALKAEFERNFKLKDDPRITRVGAFLRKLSLDELPQLFNVLRGDRKSTRLNSSHGYISYAVFCLKKKKQKYSVDISEQNV